MTNRTTSLLPCVAVAIVAAAAAVTIEFTPASAADECLTKPKETTAGKHWFYRIDRTTKKQCWYQRDDDREAHGASLVTRKLAAGKERAQLSSSAANARAEIQTSKDAGDEVKVVSSTPSVAASPPASIAFPPVAAFPAAPAPVVAPSSVASAPVVAAPDSVRAAES